ncbi:MAG: hypothetical protein FWD01_04875 [Defluviitaleaceae bacterium]|nr:hypothetical protein [Defluviitaleaceae bacterium]
MLTNLHYYGHYQNYAKSAQNPRRAAGHASWITLGKKPDIVPISPPQNAKILLNRAYKGESISYARNLSRNVVGLKDAARMFVYDALGNSGGEKFWHWIEEDIENFVTSYNGLREIAATQNHSPILVDFTAQMDSHTQLSRETILKIGMKINNRNNLEYEGQIPIRQNEGAERKKSMEAIRKYFMGSYEKASSFLEHPLAKHMNFRQLELYYNYRFGVQGNISNAFTLMENGILVDIAV